MKPIHTSPLAAFVALAALCAPAFTSAQETATVVTTTGTISSFSPTEFTVRRETGAPVSYGFTKETTFTDADGTTIRYETIKPTEPTTVYYRMVDGRPVVTKVQIVRKPGGRVVEETTTTGSISSFSPTEFTVTRESGSPESYGYSKETTFTDSAGGTITYESIKPNEPTTVYYRTVDGRRVVTKVQVARKPMVKVEETTTTTTETTKPK